MIDNATGMTANSAGNTLSNQGRFNLAGLFATGGVLAALGVSSCCVLPFVFFSAGLGGAWLSNLLALSAYQPIFIALSIGFLGAGFYYVYRKRRVLCETGRSPCATRTSSKVLKSTLWLATLLAIVGIVFPYFGQYLLEM